MRRALDIDDIDPIGAGPGVDPETRCAALESLESLNDDQQMLAIMLFVDGLSQGEAADELGLSRVTINKRAQEIRAQLRAQEASNTNGAKTQEVPS